MILRRCAAGLVVAALFPALTAAQSPLSNRKFVQGLIAGNASNVSSVVYWGTSPLTAARTMKAQKVASVTIAVNYGLGARQVEAVSADGKQRLVTTVSEGMGWMVDNGGAPVRNPLVVADFEREVAMSPHGVFKAAQAPDAKAVIADEPGPGGKVYTTVTFTAAGSRIKATLNEIGLVLRAETLPGDPVTGSAPAVLLYDDYREVDGIKFPFRITQTRGSVTVLDLTVAEIKPNVGFYAEPPASISKR